MSVPPTCQNRLSGETPGQGTISFILTLWEQQRHIETDRTVMDSIDSAAHMVI